MGVMCGGDGGTSSDAGVNCSDPKVDCLFDGDLPPHDSGPSADSGPACPLPAANADGTISDWPDWRRLSELDPCCPIDVALNPASDSTALRWVSCFDAMNCQMLDLPPRPGSLAQQISAVVKADSSGTARQLAIGRPVDDEGALIEFTVFDLNASSTVAAWREVVAPSAAGTTTCNLQFGPSLADPMLFMEVRHGLGAVNPFVAQGSFPQLATRPTFRPFSVPGFEGNQGFSSADQIFAYDDPLAGGLFRCPLNTLACVPKKSGPAAALLLDFVSTTDVFATSIHGTTGWAQEYGMADDGTISLFRSNASAHVLSTATDGTTLAWTETSGNVDQSQTQTETDVWSAPYTSSAATLATTAHKVTTLSLPTITGGATLSQGYYSLYVRGEVDVVRLVDGATQRLNPPSGYSYGNPVFVSPTEVWMPLNVASGPSGVALLRVPLAAWTEP